MEELKEIFIGIALFFLVCFVSWLLFARDKDYSPNLSSDQEQRDCMDYGEGKGCW
jgi:hypothetical protein